MPHPQQTPVAVLISANAEWQAVRDYFPDAAPQPSPYGDWFSMSIAGAAQPVLFFHGGWGKIAAAASTQYMVDRWQPGLVVNLGTCGGFAGLITTGAIVLAERTLVYDIIEQMGDFDEHIAHYTTALNLTWLGQNYPHPVRRTVLVSADRDILSEDIPGLHSRYGAIAADWESGAIAWVCARRDVRCLILRGVSDLVSATHGEAYNGNLHVFQSGARQIMTYLLDMLPAWLARSTAY